MVDDDFEDFSQSKPCTSLHYRQQPHVSNTVAMLSHSMAPSNLIIIHFLRQHLQFALMELSITLQVTLVRKSCSLATGNSMSLPVSCAMDL